MVASGAQDGSRRASRGRQIGESVGTYDKPFRDRAQLCPVAPKLTRNSMRQHSSSQLEALDGIGSFCRSCVALRLLQRFHYMLTELLYFS